MTQIKLKRAYDDAEDSDGLRVLVDRLWPRGITKERLHYDLWEKDITPSTGLREWFHDDMQDRWDDFATMYKKELSGSDAVKSFIDKIKTHDVVTLLYASREPVHNHAVILKAYLDKVLAKK
ncbi:DUF488 domain-containing protein [Prevotella sp. 10(H)]|uniref:DUF488 domain-containing protein n=1 Tax=Prevotella sp. 10(H) TaxID=1158294 RepID=UPI0004A6D5E5|nr:DUF488 family protein [Prevotella sp. 10(H)]